MSEQLIAARSVCIKFDCLFVVYYSYIWHRKALNHAGYQHTTPTFVRTLGRCKIYHCELELDGQALMDNTGCFWEVRAKTVPSTTQVLREQSGMQSHLLGIAWVYSTDFYLELLKFYECKSDDIVRASLYPTLPPKLPFLRATWPLFPCHAYW